jgi:uncharacterized protein (TIGR00251 family)
MADEAGQIELTATAHGVELGLKVVPGASRTAIVGVWGRALKVAVAAPPEAGKANGAVVELLAGILGVRRADVAVVSGHTRPVKRVAVRGMSAAALADKLAQIIGARRPAAPPPRRTEQ